jgi:hypothetical protein
MQHVVQAGDFANDQQSWRLDAGFGDLVRQISQCRGDYALSGARSLFDDGGGASLGNAVLAQASDDRLELVQPM